MGGAQSFTGGHWGLWEGTGGLWEGTGGYWCDWELSGSAGVPAEQLE